MALSRRALLAAPAAALARGASLRIGVMDGVALAPSDPESVAAAARAGCEGIQVTLGRPSTAGRLAMAAPERQRAFLAASKLYRIPIVSTYIDILHVHCLKNDAEALRWARQGIEITGALGAPILMLVFFGKCALETRGEMDAVVAPLRELAREAEKAKITLGFENTIRAEDDIRILDAVGSPALQVYYDIGNATNLYKVDPLAELRLLGRRRICQVHVKDKGYLGEGAVDVAGAVKVLEDIGWRGWLVLETGAPSGDREEDLKRNAAYLRRLVR
ncbi:MAG: sugar phosphate isomerase/epimerase [Bryobacteraceae bacterium]|nr:sugar phosphate isomerase/epimerase [Bryobacteraceae bacterium]